MALANLKTLVSKTVTAAGVKPTVPADRIGLGLVAANAYPTGNLSQGRFPTPRNPEPEQVRSRQRLHVMLMQVHQRAAADAVPPAGRAGCLLVPVSTAVRSHLSFTTNPITGWRATTVATAAAGRSASDRSSRLPAGPGQTRDPGASRSDRCRVSDCQSPAARTDKRGAATGRILAATAGK